jgi:hypothetical protein
MSRTIEAKILSIDWPGEGSGVAAAPRGRCVALDHYSLARASALRSEAKFVAASESEIWITLLLMRLSIAYRL